MATITQGSVSFLLDEATSAVMLNAFAQLDPMMGALYSVRTSRGRRERHSSFGALGQFTEKTEAARPDEDIPVQQFQKTFDHTPFGKETPVSREVIDDEEWGWFRDLGMQYGMAATRTFETLAAGPFNDAFAGVTYTSEDGLTICNSAHLNVDSGNSQSNTGTLSLTAANVKTTLINHRKLTDYEGEKIFLNPNALIVPVDLEPDAWEIVRSSQKPGSANNDANYLNNRFVLVAWRFLTDTNAWWTADLQYLQSTLLWYQRTGLEVFGDGDLFAGKRTIGAYFRQSHGMTDWRGLYGQNPS